jgi:hypothetical protein
LWPTLPHSGTIFGLDLLPCQPEKNAVSGKIGGGLTFETMLTDPLIRLVMESDGVSVAEMRAVLQAAGDAVARREQASEEPEFC